MSLGRKKKDSIPEKDLEDINASFKKDASAETLKKGSMGDKVSSPSKENVNEKGYVFQDFGGRVLKHSKSVIPKGGKQVIVGEKGQRYDDIEMEQRKKVVWLESDFE